MASSSGARAFGSSNVMALVRNETSTDALVAMLASCPPVGLHVQRGGGGGMELDAVVSCGQKRAYYPTFEAGGSQGEDLGGDEDLGDDCTGAHNVEKKRRLSFDQVRSLERNFEVENKLEPERKMQLAKELGLQPRQVAVWFQNRRARWKTKQLERDYEILTSDYNRLKNDYDTVMQEKQELQGEIECLAGKLQTGPVDGTVSEKPAAPAKTRAKAGPQSQELPLSKASEVTVKSERMASTETLAPNVGKMEDTSSDSISSEILDADSPRTMDSAPPPPPPPPPLLDVKSSAVYNAHNIVCADQIPVDSNIIHVSDHLCDQMLSPQACQRIAVKLEDGSFQDESSCNYILTQLDEERGLPWWDWP